MDYKSAVISCIERIPDTEEGNAVLKKIYELAKRAGKESRFSPTVKPQRRPSMREEVLGVMIRNRMAR